VDSRSSHQLYDLLAELNEHLAILLISHDLTAISTYVKTVGCVNRHLVYEGTKEITSEMLETAYECPVDLIAHGHPHRVLPSHMHED
jgi:zinc transport system ATP-binding protein